MYIYLKTGVCDGIVLIYSVQGNIIIVIILQYGTAWKMR